MEDLLAVGDSEDRGEENGASIAFLAEFDGRSVLFAGDAHAEVLVDSIRRLQDRKKLPVGAVKLAHHGSRNNVSQALLSKLDTRTFLISTNGASHFHPDREAIARVVAGKWRGGARRKPTVRLLFNYESDFTNIWNNSDLMDKYAYEVYYPKAADVLELSPVPRIP
jgi:beta-lactamase superfamily II metal-dependent hydrolase